MDKAIKDVPRSEALRKFREVIADFTEEETAEVLAYAKKMKSRRYSEQLPQR